MDVAGGRAGRAYRGTCRGLAYPGLQVGKAESVDIRHRSGVVSRAGAVTALEEPIKQDPYICPALCGSYVCFQPRVGANAGTAFPILALVLLLDLDLVARS